ncbi:MAG: hypothetical protein ACYCTI_08490 [Acidimicrobiales bacterium]
MVRALTRPALAGLLLAVLVAACGGGGATGGGSPAAGRSGTSTSAAPTTSTTASPAGLSYLDAWGATLVSWNDNHTIDPKRPHAYWPRLPDNRDTYTNLSDRAGRVVGYVLALDPSVSAAAALTRLANDLPLDARVVEDRTLAGCAQVVETSPTIDAIAPGGVLAELTSLSGPYQPSAVATITVSPLGTNQSPPGHC